LFDFRLKQNNLWKLLLITNMSLRLLRSWSGKHVKKRIKPRLLAGPPRARFVSERRMAARWRGRVEQPFGMKLVYGNML
jgi:hypothetical protein